MLDCILQPLATVASSPAPPLLVLTSLTHHRNDGAGEEGLILQLVLLLEHYWLLFVDHCDRLGARQRWVADRLRDPDDPHEFQFHGVHGK